MDSYREKKTRYSEVGLVGERGRGGVMDSMKKGNKEMQEKIGQLQREKDWAGRGEEG